MNASGQISRKVSKAELKRQVAKEAPGASLRAFAPGKVILLGEHAVVYGHPALVAPLKQGVTASAEPARACSLIPPSHLSPAQKKALLAAFERVASRCGHPHVQVRIESDIPVSMGLGSSAALSVSCSRLLLEAAGRRSGLKEVVGLALEMEREFHGTPSGVDHTCSAIGSLVRYSRSPTSEWGRAKEVSSRRPFDILVSIVGPRTGTKATVAALRERHAQWTERYDRMFSLIGDLARQGADAIEEGDLASLGDAMNLNHGLLSGLGLSSNAIDERIHALRAEGALGAKLTGAGGDGGAVIALFEDASKAAARLTARGVRCFIVPIGESSSP